MKVTAIQEHTGWEKKSVGELIGSLHTYELEVLADDDLAANRKGKSVAFVADVDRESDTDDIDDEALALLTKNFKKILKGFNIRSQGQSNKTQYKGSNSSYQKTDTPSFTQNNQTQTGRPRQPRGSSTDTGRSLNRSVQCRECEGFGHIQAECATYLKRKKAMSVATLSDDEEEGSNGQLDDNVGNFVAFFSELKQRDDIMKKPNTELVTKEDLITQIRSREGKLIKELEDQKKNIKMMDTTLTLNKILDSGQNPNDKKGLGYNRGESSKNIPIFVKEGTSTDTSTHRYETGQSSRDQMKEKYQNKTITPFTRQVWVRKSEVICYPTIVLAASTTKARWYFDSGCSRHMTGNVKCLMAVQPSSGSVTYGDGQKGNVFSKDFYSENGIAHEFSAPRTAQQNGVVERKN
ncbi:PREDICTED: uncharacterized protein LOC109147975 [Ipomoea nil]|uniref:uncharacterized protein LOC109147975 n=1 Tax=Ipomoea nil TaxID=35883 RepID=UPI000900AC99|nr:PREDICTED: uncharacterized protein LOC109147975 [Ipomoea nil]